MTLHSNLVRQSALPVLNAVHGTADALEYLPAQGGRRTKIACRILDRQESEAPVPSGHGGSAKKVTLRVQVDRWPAELAGKAFEPQRRMQLWVAGERLALHEIAELTESTMQLVLATSEEHEVTRPRFRS